MGLEAVKTLLVLHTALESCFHYFMITPRIKFFLL